MRSTLIYKTLAGALITLASACAQARGPDMMWWGGHGMFMGPFWLIIGVAVAIVIVVLLARMSGGAQTPPPPPAKTPLDILKERFARGEIDKAEYEDRRRTLEE